MAETKRSNVLIMPSRPRKTSWTLGELVATDFPEPAWAVKGVIPSGLACLAGRPKVGKSWLLLQIAKAVSLGGEVLGGRAEQGAVLYLALEDHPRRLKSRAALQEIPSSAPIRFETAWPSFENGGVAFLADEISRNGYRLICIDTFSRFAGRADQDKAGEMTAAMSSIHSLALGGNRLVLLSDHHRKPSIEAGTNPIDDIMGSTAKAAVVDTALGLYRTRGSGSTILKIVGRDIEEREMALRWNPMTYIWEFIGEPGPLEPGTFKAIVVGAIPQMKKQGILPSTSRIAAFIGAGRSNVSRALNDLLEDGIIIQGKRTGKEVPYDLVQD